MNHTPTSVFALGAGLLVFPFTGASAAFGFALAASFLGGFAAVPAFGGDDAAFPFAGLEPDFFGVVETAAEALVFFM